MSQHTSKKLRDVFQGTSTVTVHALQAGSLTLPANMFMDGCEPTLRLTKPSLSFLIQHKSSTGKETRLIFDLGIRRTTEEYPQPIQQHLQNRQPLSTHPDVRTSLEKGGLGADKIGAVIFSHVHWDHVGRPKDFPKSTFVVGNGVKELLSSSGASASGMKGSHSHFEPDLLPPDRVVELPSRVSKLDEDTSRSETSKVLDLSFAQWKPLLHFPAAIDVFNDQSLFIVDAPGHLQGHINLLARRSATQWTYLAGDACHDRILLTRERDIAEWVDVHGTRCCIHADKAGALETLERIRKLETEYGDEVEVVLAHDAEWAAKAEKEAKFWPGSL